jgi:Protein kinase domain/Regulator of G protein signaling domain
MGAGVSRVGNSYRSASQTKTQDEVAYPEKNASAKWKIMPSSDEARYDDYEANLVSNLNFFHVKKTFILFRLKFHADGTLSKNSDPEHLELRAVLDEPIAQQLLGNFAKENKSLEIFMCWIDVQEYKSIPTDDYRRSKALHIYHKYIKVDSVLQIGGIHGEDVQYYKSQIDLSKADHSILKTDFYDRVQNVCFTEIFYNIFRPFKKTVQYPELKKSLKERYNHVALDHFEYVRKLGEGGFGVVVHCVKISTGKHYAMKIQTKKGLLECFSDDPWRVDGEKQAFASCQHPFIVNLDYAFQNETLAIMVLGLASAGDLQKALLEAPDEKLGEDRVQFYAAELVLALAHLHQMGLMYRDLKPNNVLVNDDGHVQLVDLGGVVDEDGKVIGAQHETNTLLPLFTHQYSAVASATRAHYLNDRDRAENPEAEEGDELRPLPSRKRRMSIMGTFG